MPSYTRPGVYVEENLTPLPQATSTPGQSTAAFVGTSTRGPVGAVSVTSWSDFVRIYGGIDGGYLAYAVYLYFSNGGRAAWVSRDVNVNAVAATVDVLSLDDPGPTDAFSVTAKSVGAWGNDLTISVSDPDIVDAGRPGRFDFVVKYNGTIVERFTDLSLDPADARYFGPIVNSPTSGSAWVDVVIAGPVGTSYLATDDAPVVQADTALTTGSDGTGADGLGNAIDALELVDDVILLNLPGNSDQTDIGLAQAHAELTGRAFVIVDSPAPVAGDDSTAALADITAILPGGASALDASSLLAVYGPWLTVADPGSSASGASITLPAGGAVAGRFVTADATNGVQRPAAGILFPLSGVLTVAQRFNGSEQDTLFAGGFNLIKAVPGAGYVIWGARTLAQATPDRSVSIRRTLLTIKAELLARTQFAVFAENNDSLWETLENVVEQYLSSILQAGVLKGGSAEEAYYVVCDDTNNTLLSVSNGEVHIEVGVALQTPAEFVVIRIGQFDGVQSAEEV